MPRLRKNNLNDVEGLLVGHYTDTEAVCGVTVVICSDGATAGVDVRGSAPGTRETDLLDPSALVEKTHAVVLSGGSVFGLAASDGVVRWLADRGIGFPVEEKRVVPIVPAAVLYDLGRGKDFIPPIHGEWGRKACQDAKSGLFALGCAGAGTGALSGGMKGGLGSASLLLDSGITVAALVAVNSFGSVIDPDTGRPWETRLELHGEFGIQGKRRVKLPPPPEGSPIKNTTLGVVATDAILSRAQARKIAQMAHDGIARAIRPSHTMFDGDTIFCLATGKKRLPDVQGFFETPGAQAINELGHAAADCLSRAIILGVLNAGSLAGMTAFRDLEDL